MTTPEERISKTGLQLPRFGQAARLFGRALIVHCPNCGRGPVLVHWLKLRERCGNCGLKLQRGEHDYFVGSMVTLFAMVGISVLTALVGGTGGGEGLRPGRPLVLPCHPTSARGRQNDRRVSPS